jgi:hypothetical protein
MTEAEFFAALKATCRDYFWGVEDAKYIRALSKKHISVQHACPIVAVYKTKTGEEVTNAWAWEVGQKLGLEKHFIAEIVEAADEKFIGIVGSTRPKYRERLIEILDLPREDIP